jgi:hypothetical protein
MLSRSKVAIGANSLFAYGYLPQIHPLGLTRAASPKSSFNDELSFNRPVCNMHHAAPHCFQIVMFDQQLAWVVSLIAVQKSASP